MLEFLVLGQVPGTHFQITFAWYLFFALGLMSYLLHKVKKSQHSVHSKTKNQLKTLN